jgi:hypothetical protein
MRNSLTEGLTADNILSAIADIDRGLAHPFGPPIRYELMHGGKGYPPKAVVGLAVKHASGRIVGPEDFSAGEAPGQANYILRKLGFTVVNKDTTDPSATNSFVTSRSFALPTDAEEMVERLWFNMWQPRLWPYRELKVGDWLYWYDPTKQAIVWQSLVSRVERFEFNDKFEVRRRLRSLFGVDVSTDPYFKTTTDRGHCLAYEVDSLVACNLAKPAKFRLPHLGWLRGSDVIVREWLDPLLSFSYADGAAATDLSSTSDLVDASGYFSSTSLTDERERKLREIVARRGQPDFRNRLIAAYGRICAVTGCDAVAALEAAHIMPYCGPQSNHVANGLLLRADIHTLFDLDLLGIEPETRTVSVAPSIEKSCYGQLQGCTIRTPVVAKAAPDRKALAERWRRFAATG